MPESMLDEGGVRRGRTYRFPEPVEVEKGQP